MGLAFESIGPHLDSVANDWSNGVAHGATWPAKLFAAKYHAVEESWRIVDPILDGATPLATYAQGSWGPKEADDLIQKDGRKWRG